MIKIPNTNINYPVMESKNHPNYYLYRNFNKEYSRYGTPYIQENCELNESDNTIIYGHNMKTNSKTGLSLATGGVGNDASSSSYSAPITTSSPA